MNKRIFLVFIVALLSLLTITVLAHSGRTDSSGGHWNRSTGEYHYHHGYPPHDHYDIDGDGYVDCPITYVPKDDVESAKQDEDRSFWETVVHATKKWIPWLIVLCSVALFMWAIAYFLNADSESTGCGCFVFYIIMLFVCELFDSYSYTALYIIVGVGVLSLLYCLLHDWCEKEYIKERIDNYDKKVKEYTICEKNAKKKENQYLKCEQVTFDLLGEIFELDDEKQALKEEVIKCHTECNTRFVKFMLLFNNNHRHRLKKVNESVYSLQIIKKEGTNVQRISKV